MISQKEISEPKSQKGEYIMHESIYIKLKNRQTKQNVRKMIGITYIQKRGKSKALNRHPREILTQCQHSASEPEVILRGECFLVTSWVVC